MDTRTRARLAALTVGLVVFLLACTCSSTFLNIVTLLLGLQSPTLAPGVRSLVNGAVGGGGLLAGLVVAAVVANLAYRRLAH